MARYRDDNADALHYFRKPEFKRRIAWYETQYMQLILSFGTVATLLCVWLH